MLRFTSMRPPWEMHGRDLGPLLQNPNARWDHPAMLVATGRKYGSDTNQIPQGADAYHGEVPWYVMIRDRRYKYVRPLVNDLEELYDLDKDPEELDNLSVKAQHKTRLRQMRAQAIAELRRTRCGFVDGMPPVREA
jgi:arylsulfatase A-like enzyme